MPFDVSKYTNRNQYAGSNFVSNVSGIQWNSRKGSLEPTMFKEKAAMDVQTTQLPNSAALQKKLVLGDNAIVPLTDSFPMANNGCGVYYGLPGSGKTTGILTAIQIIMDMIPHIEFNEGVEMNTGEGELEDYFENKELITFNDGGKELPLLACYVTSPTANYDVKFQQLGVPIIAIEDLDILSKMITANSAKFDRWWRTGKLLMEMKKLLNKNRNSKDLSGYFNDLKTLFTGKYDMRMPDVVKTSYNVGVLVEFFKNILTNDSILEDYIEVYRTFTKGQKERFMFMPDRSVNYRDADKPFEPPFRLIERFLDEAHGENQNLGVLIKSPYNEDYFVSIRPRSFVVVDDHAGEDYIHKSNTAFTRMIQRRRHLHTSMFIALQRMHALSRFSRSMVTDVVVYPGYGDNFLRDIWEEHFTEAIPSYDLFKKIYSRCALNGYKPLVYFKEAGEFRCGFTEVINGISVNGHTFDVGGKQPEKNGI